MLEAVVDEGGLFHAENAESLLDEFRSLTQLLERLRLIDTVVATKHSSVWQARIRDDLQLFELLFVPGHLDDDIRELLRRELDRLTDCDAATEVASAREYAVGRISIRRPCALISLHGHSRIENAGGARLHTVASARELISFYREAMDFGDFDERQFVENATRAFPALYVPKHIEQQLGRFSRSYRSMRSEIVNGLSDLNDFLPAILTSEVNGAAIVTRFGVSSQFSISPESPKTHKNKTAMKERDVIFKKVKIDGVEFGDIKLRCEWHLKLGPTRDRIHYSPTQYGRIFIGIMTEHLTV